MKLRHSSHGEINGIGASILEHKQQHLDKLVTA